MCLFGFLQCILSGKESAGGIIGLVVGTTDLLEDASSSQAAGGVLIHAHG